MYSTCNLHWEFTRNMNYMVITFVIYDLYIRHCSSGCTLHSIVENSGFSWDIQYVNLGQMLPATHEKHTQSVLLPLWQQEKRNNVEFPPAGIYVSCPPQGIRLLSPPRHVAAVTASDAFSTTGDKSVLSPPWACAFGWIVHTKIVLKIKLKHDKFYVFTFLLPQKRNCYPPPTSITCLFPLPVTYMPGKLGCYPTRPVTNRRACVWT